VTGPLVAPSPPDLDRLLLDVKLSIPQPRPGAVSRRALIEGARAGGSRVVGVTAPAGYGKSTFLAEWARAEDRRVAWVSLDRFDDDPVTFLRVLAYAYGRIDHERPDIVAEVRGVGASVLGRAAPRLAAAFGTSPAPFVLFLDDLHELRSPDCHDVLGLIIEKLPPGSQLVKASRFEQPHLPRLRTLGQALELSAADLALDAAGAQLIFAAEHVRLPPELAAVVIEKTEGWPAGLYLAAVITKESPGQVGMVSGDDRYVADYLYREFWSRQPADLQMFLRATAVLDQLCGPLCDAVLGSSGGAAQLRQLEASSSFIIPLDRRRQWYRYHALFREFLLGELGRSEPGDIEKLHLRAADWYEANGAPRMAVEHLLQTAERDRSLQLVTRSCLETYEAGDISTSLRWLSTLGDAHIARYPPLAVLAGDFCVLTGDTAGAERWWAFVEAASFELVPADGSASFDSARAMMRGMMCPRGPQAMMADAALMLSQEQPGSLWRDSALYLLAEAHLLEGQLSDARTLFAEASHTAALFNNADNVIICESHLALLAMDSHDWHGARDHLDLALAQIDEKHMGEYLLSALTYPAASRLALHHGDRSEAQARLVQGMRARPQATYVFPSIAVRLRLEMAKLHIALSNTTAARQLLREIDDIFTRRPALGSLVDDTEALQTALSGTQATGPSPLTSAELRLLPYLQTHLTARDIGARLFVSRHTINTQIASIYRKLGVSSRRDAVDRATTMGLLGG
jgi:LuxR family transcriptional regulator, maltose regulon positive regulatory protein